MTIHDIRRSEGGFTLIELLVATTMALIVFAATLSALTVFSDTSQALDHRNDSQNQARLEVDQIVSQLRNAATSSSAPTFVEQAGPYDLVFQTVPVSGGPTELVRYCVPPDPTGSSAAEELITQTLTPATPSSQWTTTDEPPCPDAAYGSSVILAHVTNRRLGAARPVFTYNGTTMAPSDLTTIKSVGVDLFVNTTPADSKNEYELQSSALLRNAQAPPVAVFTWSQGASGTVVLDGGASYSPSDDPLTYAWRYVSSGGTSVSCKTTGSSTPVGCPSTASTITWTPNPGPGTYTVTLTVTDQAGLQSTPFTRTVTVQ